MTVKFIQANDLDDLKAAIDAWIISDSPSAISSITLTIGKTGAYIATIAYTA